MVELIKPLIEEPKRLIKIFTFFIKIVLSTIFCSFLFEEPLNEYAIINYDNLEFWTKNLNIKTLESLVILLFLFIISYLLLFVVIVPIIEIILKKIINLLLKIKIYKDFDYVTFTLRLYNVISKDKISKRIVPGENFDEFYDFYEEIAKISYKEARSEMHSIKSSLISKILEIYLASVIIIFFVINIKSNWLTSSFIIIFGFIICSAYFSLDLFLQLHKLHRHEVLKALRYFKIINVIDEFIAKYRLNIINEKVTSFRYKKDILIDKINYSVDIYQYERPISTKELIYLKNESIEDHEYKIIFTLDKQISKKAKKFLKKNRKTMKVLFYDKEEILISKLESTIFRS